MSPCQRNWLLLGAAAILALGLGVLTGWLRHEPGPATLDAGELYATQFPDAAGRPQAFSQWKGKVLVINFWATWCPPCRHEIPDFIAAQRELGDKGLAIVGIALDDAQAVAAYGKELQINYPLLIGGAQGSAFGRALGNDHGGLPFTVFVDREGNVVAAKTGLTTRGELEKMVRSLL